MHWLRGPIGRPDVEIKHPIIRAFLPPLAPLNMGEAGRALETSHHSGVPGSIRTNIVVTWQRRQEMVRVSYRVRWPSCASSIMSPQVGEQSAPCNSGPPTNQVSGSHKQCFKGREPDLFAPQYCLESHCNFHDTSQESWVISTCPVLDKMFTTRQSSNETAPSLKLEHDHEKLFRPAFRVEIYLRVHTVPLELYHESVQYVSLASAPFASKTSPCP